jgi:hypothetical protein
MLIINVCHSLNVSGKLGRFSLSRTTETMTISYLTGLKYLKYINGSKIYFLRRNPFAFE